MREQRQGVSGIETPVSVLGEVSQGTGNCAPESQGWPGPNLVVFNGVVGCQEDLRVQVVQVKVHVVQVS